MPSKVERERGRRADLGLGRDDVEKAGEHGIDDEPGVVVEDETSRKRPAMHDVA
jgi:hypothetical protein